ncbi:MULTISPECIES: ASCH domain-containing protein [Brevibacterium]|nr:MULTISPECIES: ASCH domain-containing protein [Brevibacterium]
MTDMILDRFWAEARSAVPTLPVAVPEAWAFGATAAHADELLTLVLDCAKTGTASAMQDVKADGEPVPEVGQASVILDSRGQPRAVIVTTAVDIVPFSQVSAEHAYSEGEGDRSLAAWREIHERFWAEHCQGADGFSEDMLVVCERFESVFAP